MKMLIALSMLIGLSAQAAEFTISVNKAGTVTTTSLDACPSGTLEAKGQEVSRTAYLRLYAVMHDKYGAGDHSLTFNVPDYRGYFLRSADDEGAHAPDGIRSVGSGESDQFRAHNHGGGNHSHSITHHNWNYFSSGSTTSWGDYPYGPISDSQTNGSGIIINTEGGSETRPTNVAVKYCISY